MEQVKTLDQIMCDCAADKGSKWHGFTYYYERLFDAIRNEPVCLMEIGIQFGNSAKGWLEYFPYGKIIGVDLTPPPPIESDRWRFFQGDQSNPAFLHHVGKDQGPFDVIIDDGSHRASDAKVSFETLWPYLKAGGCYSIEDVCTYWDFAFASAVSGPEWLKSLIAEVNWHGKDYAGKPRPEPFHLSEFEETVEAIHFSKHLCLIQKK